MTGHNAKILVVDDDQAICSLLSNLVKAEGFKSLQGLDGKTALEIVRSESPDAMLLDMKLPDMNGMEVLRQAKEIDSNLPVIVITGYSDTQGAIDAMKAGAFDYIGKPFEIKDVLRVVHHALDGRKLKQEATERSAQKKNSLKEAMGPSDVVERIVAEVNRVAGSEFTVVITGETGSGKELVARAIQEESPRSKAPFVPVDCGAIPENLLESELFGHEKGAFTGADVQKHGTFEIAQGGTLFLDEISNMPLGSQSKLLRVLQEKKIYRVGGTKSIRVDVRLLVATNQDLYGLVESGSFRKDLFYRLNEFCIVVPPLRDRKEDIPYLAKRFLDTANRELKKNVKGFSESALDVLFNYNWPGNVRQLRSTIRRATLLAEDKITENDLDLKRIQVRGFTPKVQDMPWQGLSLREIVKQGVDAIEREVLTQVLKHVDGNKAKAARVLQIDYKTIHMKLKRYGIGTQDSPTSGIERVTDPHPRTDTSGLDDESQKEALYS